MTKQEAIELENRCDKLMSAYLNTECSVALSLGGKFKVLFTRGGKNKRCLLIYLYNI